MIVGKMTRALAGHGTWLAGLFALAVLLHGCGGGAGGADAAGDGGSFAAVGSGGTGAAVSGPIRGFGSVIVNGTRYDDSAAAITLDDDVPGRSIDLRLGMMVELEGEISDDRLKGRAGSISASSLVRGPIAAIDTAGNRLTVLGTQVFVTAETVFDGAGVSGLASLRIDDRVEVYGIADGAQGVRATRIEKTSDTEARLVGTVQGASGNAFLINGVTVRYQPSALVNLNSVANGTLVRVKGSLANPNEITARAVRGTALTPAADEGKFVEIEGIVTRFASLADFDVDGQAVAIDSSTKAEGVPALGARIEVEGRIKGNRLQADKVEVKNEQQSGKESSEMHGTIESVDAVAGTFTMRSGTVTVRWDAGTVFRDLNAAALAPGVKLQVKGRTSGNVLLATRIDRES